MIGGNSNNQVPGSASMILDIRFTSKTSINDIISNIKNIDKDVKINVLIEGMCFISNLDDIYVKKYIKAVLINEIGKVEIVKMPIEQLGELLNEV